MLGDSPKKGKAIPADPRTSQPGLWTRFSATALALVSWAALLLQLWLALETGRADGQPATAVLANYISYFTILTNLLVAVVFSWTALSPTGPPPKLAAATAVYITIVAVGYSLLLRHIWDPHGWQKIADVLLHDVMPLAYILFWVVFLRRRSPLPWTSAFSWLLPPLAYLIYSLIRGALAGWYPYYFLDSRVFSWTQITITIVVFLAGFLVIGLLAILLTRRRSPVNLVAEQVSPNK